MTTNEKTTNTGLSVSTVLTLIFVTLKLCNVIDWSWWWVLAPTWISLGLALVLCIIVIIASLCKANRKAKRELEILSVIKKNCR